MSQSVAEDTICTEVNDIEVIFIMLVQNTKESFRKEVISISEH